MATIMNDAAYMGFPLSIKRGNPAPVDTTAVWYNKTELETYAKSGATAYVGQVLALVADGKCDAYMISNAAGTLVKLASTTASGDLAADVAALQTKVNNIVAEIGKAATEDAAATGLYKLIAEAKAAADAKVASVGAADNSIAVSTGDAKNPKINVRISADSNNALILATDGLKVVVPEVDVPEYSIKKLETAAAGASASYALTKDGTQTGVSIDIPKDMVVSGGSVQTYVAGELPEGVTKPGTYIVLVLANATQDKLYIDVGGLIEYVKGGTADDGVITTNVSADTHVVTATINTGKLTKDMMNKSIQLSLAKADQAVLSVTEGETNGTIKVDDAEVKVHGLGTAAFTSLDDINLGVNQRIDDAKEVLIGKNTDTKAEDTIYGAKAYADDAVSTASTTLQSKITEVINALDYTDKEIAKQFVTAVNESDGKISVTRKALTSDDIPEIGMTKITGLQGALDAKQDNLAFEGTYNSSTNKVVTKSALDTAIGGVIGTGEDAATADTINGVRKLVNQTKTDLIGTASDTKDSNTITGAKKYADNIKTQAGAAVLGSETDKWDTQKTIYAVHNEITAAQSTLNETINGVKTTAEAANTQATANKTAIETLNGTGVGSVAKKITDAIAGLNYTDTAKAGQVVSAVNETDGKISVTRRSLVAADIPEIAHTKISDWDTELGKKQDNLVFNTAYNAGTNKVATMTDVNNAVAGLAGAMHFVGTSTTDPTLEAGPTVAGVTSFKAGDVITYEKAEYVFDKTGNWILFGDEGSYAVKGAIKNVDIATDAAIAQSKVADLTTDLTNRYTKTEVDNKFVAKVEGSRLMTSAEGDKLGGIATGAQVNVLEAVKVNGTALAISGKAVNIPVGGSSLGVVKTTTAQNGVGIAADGTMTVNNLNVNKLVQTEGEELILNGGNATGYSTVLAALDNLYLGSI